MGTITAKSIIDTVTVTLQDDANVRWTRAELLGYLNDGQREIVLAKPDSYAKNTALQMVAGTKQAIPPDGIMFMRLTRNMGVNGATPGRVVREIEMRILDEQIADWHYQTPNPVAMHFCRVDQDPKRFYVFPPQPAVNPSQMEIIYSAVPLDVTAEVNPITLDDIYKTPLIHYILYRAYTKDADYARQDAAGGVAYKTFASLIGLKVQADAVGQAMAAKATH